MFDRLDVLPLLNIVPTVDVDEDDDSGHVQLFAGDPYPTSEHAAPPEALGGMHDRARSRLYQDCRSVVEYGQVGFDVVAVGVAVMKVAEVLKELKKKSSEQTRKTLCRHGAPENTFGVKVGDLKVIAKKIKGQQDLACDLYDTGISDAMYLAGLVADGSMMTKKQLEAWVKSATWPWISEYTVPWVTSESKHGRDLALKWMKSRKESVAAAGWCTYTGIVTITPDAELDLVEIRELLDRVVREIGEAPNRVKYTMNGFVISVGGYVKPLLRQAKSAAKKIGKVEVDVGDTSCKVPLATEYIEKMEKSGRIGRKRKTTKC